MTDAFLSTFLQPRGDIDQSAAAAAMAAWSAGIAYAINFIVLYLIMAMLVVVVVGVMGCLASARVRKSPNFIILAICSALCTVAGALNTAMSKDAVVNPQKPFNADIYTSLIALSMAIPFLVDLTLVLRILAFFPGSSAAVAGRKSWKRWAAIAFPAVIKVPRAIVICHYILFVHQATLAATSMADVIAKVNQKQWALIEWVLMLFDGLYCTAFLSFKLYELGWGWGQDKHVSRNFLDTLKRILISVLACFVLPSFFLIALIVMQALQYRPDIEGYVFATFIPLTVISAAFATLWPAIRAEQQRQKTNSTPMHTLRSQGHSNKFLTTQRSFDTDDEKEIGKLQSQSNVNLAELEHQSPSLGSKETICDKPVSPKVPSQRLMRPQNPLRYAPDVSGIAITTVTEEKWSEA